MSAPKTVVSPGDPLKPVAGQLPIFKALARPTEVAPVGKYAMRFVWNDGHEHGIYTWTYLREFAPAGMQGEARLDHRAGRRHGEPTTAASRTSPYFSHARSS